MNNLLARREYPLDIPQARLNAVWYVDADHTYRVTKKKGSFESSYVAVRTLTGQGEMTLFCQDSYLLGANSLAVFPAFEPAHYEAGANGWQFYWFEFDMPGPDPGLLRQVTDIPLSARERGELERCFVSLGSGAARECIVAEALFNYLLADWQFRAEGTVQKAISREQLIPLLEKGRRERLSVTQMAREAGMCERSFRNAVQEVTGLSPKAYMLKGEMTAAMELLRTTNMPISEIASCFHYSSPFYFSRVFKNYYGISPQHVRNGLRL